MPKITFKTEGAPDRTFEAKEGETVLYVALNHNVDLEHNCGGNCACTTCHVIVREGGKNLSEMDEDEEDRLDTAEGLTLASRLGCQARIKG
ncbi:MAG TPA: 2Fe-2S iron-sulfur cluster-binding protein, partial [Candidatus Manganitrophaceae bacterium]